MKRGRPPYNYRRYIELVQVLAKYEDSGSGILALCEAWGVKPATYLGKFVHWRTVERLAQAAIEYHRAKP